MILTLTGLNILKWSSEFEMNGSCYTIKRILATPSPPIKEEEIHCFKTELLKLSTTCKSLILILVDGYP